MKLRIPLSAITVVFILAAFQSVSNAASPVLSRGLEQILDDPACQKSDSLISVVIFLEDEEGKSSLTKHLSSPQLTRDARIRRAVTQLRSAGSAYTDKLKDLLESHSALHIRKYWIVPALSADVPLSAIKSLANLAGVRRIIEDAALTFDPPVKNSKAAPLSTSVSSQIEQLNVPYLWRQGLSGAGRLVCSFDTGVEYDHPALAGKWRGHSSSLNSAWFSKISPQINPSDRTGHGTHTMGIMLGSSGADTIGVAPGAEWITAAVIDQGRPLSTTISDILEAFQWALNPDGDINTSDDVPDVILNSWGIPKGLFEPCDETFVDVITNVEAAGIVTIFAAGNEGPDASSLRNPADMALTPLTSFAVGAVDGNSIIAGFSSRGPSSCDGTTIKPEVVAPGISVRSSYKDGEYRVLSGTSMAAPFIAGVVALMRQYNPNATVQQIKNALISSAVDLGADGQDNAYGHGLVDASRLLDYLPSPELPQFSIAGVQSVDGGQANPNEDFKFRLVVDNTNGYSGAVTGRIASRAEADLTILSNQAVFVYDSTGTVAESDPPFAVHVGDNHYNGQEISLKLMLEAAKVNVVDTLEFTLTVGYKPIGTFATLTTSQIDLTVSDFGQYGLAPGSIYNVLGEGFRVNGSMNLLYEAGILLGRNSDQLATSVRDSLGNYAVSDFEPIATLSESWNGPNGGIHRSATLQDVGSGNPLPVTITQEVITYPLIDDNGLVILKYKLRNSGFSDLTGVHFGVLADFDLLGEFDHVGYDAELNLLYQYSSSGPAVGLIGLNNISLLNAFENGADKSGMTNWKLMQVLRSESHDFLPDSDADWIIASGSGALDIPARDSVELVLAIIGGYDLSIVYDNSAAARELYRMSTDIDDSKPLTPNEFSLSQNYPNPFNPTTTVSFMLPHADNVTLDIYNLLGQKVTSLYSGYLSGGSHSIEWNATTESGTLVAGGVYFYRLSTSTGSVTRKMVFLK